MRTSILFLSCAVTGLLFVSLSEAQISPEEAQRRLAESKRKSSLTELRKGRVPAAMPELSKMDEAEKDALIEGLYYRDSKSQIALKELNSAHSTLRAEYDALSTAREELFAQHKKLQEEHRDVALRMTILENKAGAAKEGVQRGPAAAPNAAQNEVPKLTIKRFKVFAEKYVDKEVQFSNVELSGPEQCDLGFLLPNRLAGNGARDWLKCNVTDENFDRLFNFHVFANKQKFGEFLATVDEDRRYTVTAKVVKLQRTILNEADNYGIIITKITPAKQ